MKLTDSEAKMLRDLCQKFGLGYFQHKTEPFGIFTPDASAMAFGSELLLAAKEKMPKWVPVSERLPEIGRLVILVYGGFIVYVGRLNDAGKWQLSGGTLLDSVTYGIRGRLRPIAARSKNALTKWQASRRKKLQKSSKNLCDHKGKFQKVTGESSREQSQ